MMSFISVRDAESKKKKKTVEDDKGRYLTLTSGLHMWTHRCTHNTCAHVHITGVTNGCEAGEENPVNV